MSIFPPANAQVEGATLKDLLLDPTDEEGRVNWSAVSSRLQTHPCEAAGYGRGCVSPLQYALSKNKIAPPAAVVRQILECHPQASIDKDGDGSSALYYACYYGQSYEVVEVLLEFNEEAASWSNAYGILPLHVARTTSVARLLLCSYSHGLNVRSNWSSLPLHYAASMAETEPDVVRLFVEEGIGLGLGGPNGGGGLFSAGSSGKLPYERVCERIAATSKRDKHESVTHTNECSSEAYCEKLIILVDLMLTVPNDFFQTINLRKGGNILHTMIELNCPPMAISYALKKNPIWGVERNEMGQLPLSIAALKKTPKEVIHILLNPLLGLTWTAAIADSEGRLPLHLAVENGMEYDEGVEDLLKAEPRALESRDGKEHMFPFMLAALAEGGTVNCVFNLIRRSPSIATPLLLQNN